jgi:hypothetical protein
MVVDRGGGNFGPWSKRRGFRGSLSRLGKSKIVKKADDEKKDADKKPKE